MSDKQMNIELMERTAKTSVEMLHLLLESREEGIRDLYACVMSFLHVFEEAGIDVTGAQKLYTEMVKPNMETIKEVLS